MLSVKASSRLYAIFLLHLHNMCAVGIPVFGPSARAARMEGSKSFSKEFMSRHNIPTAQYKTFTASQYNEAVEYVKTCGFKTVLKADGLAGGKGVLIPESIDEAVAGLHDILVANAFGSAGQCCSQNESVK